MCKFFLKLDRLLQVWGFRFFICLIRRKKNDEKINRWEYSYYSYKNWRYGAKLHVVLCIIECKHNLKVDRQSFYFLLLHDVMLIVCEWGMFIVQWGILDWRGKWCSFIKLIKDYKITYLCPLIHNNYLFMPMERELYIHDASSLNLSLCTLFSFHQHSIFEDLIS